MKTLQAIFFCAAILLLTPTVASADIYPATLDNGNLVLVDAGMGVARYANRASVAVQMYAPPNYRIAIDIVIVTFSEDYWRQHSTYIGGSYKFSGSYTAQFRYNWDRKIISYQRGDSWFDWDINRDYSHAEGDPFVPNAAEVAFVSAYNMKFFGNMTGYSPALKENRRVVNDSLHRALNI